MIALHRLKLVAVVIAIGCPVAASASFDCSPCEFDPTAQQYYDFDFTVPPDGRTYRWTMTFTSADPGALLSLDSPNQTETFLSTRDGSGFVYDPNPPYRFDLTFASGRTTILVQAPRQFDFCDEPGPGDEFCQKIVHIWGNGTAIHATGTAPIFATFSETLVPEPASWTLMIAGFGAVGTVARRRRPAGYMKL